MLGILRRVFSFTDWTQHHPNEPPPGDQLDASFDAQNSRISELEQLVLKVLRDDGRLRNEIVGLDALAPDFQVKFNEILKASVSEIALKVTIPAEKAISAGDHASKDAEAAKIAAAEAQIAANEVRGTRQGASAQVNQLISQATALQKAIKDAVSRLEASEQDWDDASSEAEAWAQASRDWAEFMPGTLPDNSVKIMDVTGEHWSARWWAHYADNAFGRMTDLYLGVHEDPPATDPNGNPIPPGAIYYDSSKNQTYIWDGSQWVSLAQPQRAGMMTLWYTATAGQQDFNTATPDEQGLTYILNADPPEGLDVHRQGLKLVPEGEWTANHTTSTVHLITPANAGDKVAIDIMVPVERLGPGPVQAWLLKPLVGIDGTTTTFALECAAVDAPAVTVDHTEELMVSVDGVIQQPTAMYSASGDEITFVTAPAADSVVFITWLRPDVGSGLATSMSGEEILAALAPVDGSGSGLDADTLDGRDSLYFATDADLDAEASTRALNDGTLQTNINAEATARANADTNLTNQLAAKAPLADPTFTGSVNVPTYAPITASTLVASTAFVANQVSTINTSLNGKVAKAGDTMTGKLNLPASAAGGAGINLGSGAAPSSPIDGDVWVTSSGYFVRFNGTTYSGAMLNGSSTFTGTKTFSVPPVMATPAAGQASIRLPPGVDPSAPANGDVWGTSTGLFARVNGVTYNLTNTFPEAPTDGQQYVRQMGAWAPVDVPPGTLMQDTPPSSPDPGQMWWETDTGRLFIWYVDATGPGQWVQINPAGGDAGVEDAPYDDGEYVRVNGVWRLSRQTFVPSSTGQAITVPPTAKVARVYARCYAAAAGSTNIALRLSADGSTFLAGATSYTYGGLMNVTGSSASPTKLAHATQSYFPVTPNTDVTYLALVGDFTLSLTKMAGQPYNNIMSRGTSFNSAATTYIAEYNLNGYYNSGELNAVTQLPAFQLLPTSGGTWVPATSFITVDWIY